MGSQWAPNGLLWLGWTGQGKLLHVLDTVCILGFKSQFVMKKCVRFLRKLIEILGKKNTTKKPGCLSKP